VFGRPLSCRNHISGDDRKVIAGEPAEILAGDFGCAPHFVRRGNPILELIAVLRQCARGNKVAQENPHRHDDMRENGNDRLVPHEKPPGRKPPAPCRSEGEWTAVVAKPNGRVTRKEPWLRSPLNQELNDFSSFRLCLTLRIEFLKERKFKLGLFDLPQSRIRQSQPVVRRCQLRIRLDRAREKYDALVELSFPLGNDAELQMRFRKAGIEMNCFTQIGFGRLVIGVGIVLGAQI